MTLLILLGLWLLAGWVAWRSGSAHPHRVVPARSHVREIPAPFDWERE